MPYPGQEIAPGPGAQLSETVGDIVRAATAQAPQEMTWHVDAFYPEVTVAAKISGNVRTIVAATTCAAKTGSEC